MPKILVLVVLAGLRLALPAVDTFPTERDPQQWPFAKESIWNTPIGSLAQYRAQPLNPDHVQGVAVDTLITVIRPQSSLMEVFGTEWKWQDGTTAVTRAIKFSDTVHLRLPIPSSYVTIFSSTKANNPAAILLGDGETVLCPGPPFQACPGGYATNGVRTSTGYPIDAIPTPAQASIRGDGRYNAGGGSGLNSLGGTIRIGELAPGAPPIRHALKISLPGAQYLYYDHATDIGYRWPAFKHDSGASTLYLSSEPEAKTGCLRALPPSVDINALGLETEPGRKIAWTLQNYGAYQVEGVPWERIMIVVEEGPDGYVANDFASDYGYPMISTSKDSNPWLRDLLKIMAHLHIVTNNGPTSIGGGGTPRQPLAPPFAGSNSAPTISAIAAQTTAEDTAKSVSFTIGDVETAADSLTLAKASANTTLLPLSGIVLGGSGAERTVTLTPAANQSGTATVTLTVTDAGGLSASRSFVLTVTAVNDPPTLSTVADQQVLVGQSTGALPVTVGDVETAAASLTLGAASSNPGLVPTAGLVLGGSGANRSITVTPAAGTAGSATITLTISDGTATAQRSFIVTVPALPAGFSSQDIGTVGAAGSALGDGSSFTVSGSGADIWNKADAFRYVWVPVTGDFDQVARIESQTNTNAWAKAGLMLRESSAAGSRHVSVFVTPGNGTTLQYRSSTGGSSGSVAGPKVKAPTWLKLSRRGTTISGYQSADGMTWKLIATRTLAIPASAQLGLAVTSHKAGTLSTAVFSHLAIVPMASN